MTMAENRSLDQVTSNLPEIVQLGLKSAVRLYQGSFAAPLTANGYLTVGGGVASTNAVMGIASAEANNTDGSDGDLSVNLAQGVFRRKNSSTSPCVAATAGVVVYAEDGETVRIASGATYPVAGIFLGFEADGTTPLVFVSAVVNYLLSQGTLETNLAAVTTGLGASKIGIEDAAGNFAATEVEAALAELITLLAGVTGTTGGNLVGYDDGGSKTSAATVADALDEIYVDLTSAYAFIDVPFDASWYEIDGTALAAFADGASTTPGLALDNAKAAGIRWNNHANPDPICKSIALPWDLDEAADVIATITASKSDATLADATTFDLGVFNNVIGATADADTDYGGVTAAMTGDAAAKTMQAVTRTLALANLPNPDAACQSITVTVQPTDGLIDTDDVTAHTLRLRYRRKLRTS